MFVATLQTHSPMEESASLCMSAITSEVGELGLSWLLTNFQNSKMRLSAPIQFTGKWRHSGVGYCAARAGESRRLGG